MTNYTRLTKRYSDGEPTTQCLREACPYWEKCSRDDKDHCRKLMLEKLTELEDYIENGMLKFLPCKVGDTVWHIKNYGFGRYIVEAIEVVGFNFSRYEDAVWVVGKYEEQASHIYKTETEAKQRCQELIKEYANRT